MRLSTNYLEAIIASVLSVNSYGLEKAIGLLPALRKTGLTDPLTVTKANVPEVMVWFHQAGYRRGMLSEMMAGRLISLMKAVAAGNLDGLNELVATGNKAEACEMLCQIKGIGPKVASDVWVLLTGTPEGPLKRM